MIDEYKIVIILVYLKSLGDNYTFKDLTRLMSLDYEKIDETLKYMEEKKYLVRNEFQMLSISNNGKSLLQEYNLLDITIDELSEPYKIKESLIPGDKEMTPIYIPRYFDKCFNGYKK
ncbi:hypothetical protein [Clostridium beijerinckii]|uniref:hypothetical protein n=1 Tax=Clostridium beijerinckii TaxID=1520 RepID=UPI00098CECD6|nr:hypothetical protein [Clostridium beijerinckii]NRT80937.1 DNA-binding HxlR family transcriptional regulator [Clostridium beijerinckii]OOM48269.1 hypothetical protein CBEIJ_24480 [Clostridium beijerinckii]